LTFNAPVILLGGVFEFDPFLDEYTANWNLAGSMGMLLHYWYELVQQSSPISIEQFEYKTDQ
jgi:hypothetical protein